MTTKTAQHTAAPWKLIDGNITQAGSGARIAALNPGWPDAEIEANALVMVAAPDLLDALDAAFPLLILAAHTAEKAGDHEAQTRYAATAKLASDAIIRATVA